MSNPPPPPPSSSSWFFSYSIRLQFFSRIRRLIHAKSSAKKRSLPSSNPQPVRWQEEENQLGGSKHGKQETAMADSDKLRKAVKELLFGRWEEREKAAAKIGRMAREDADTRKTLAELGVVPELVAMVGSDVADRRRLAVQALVHLATGNFTNKALMVEAGILSKIPTETDNLDQDTTHDFTQLLLCISSLANTTQFPLHPAKILPFLTSTLESNPTPETKASCLGCLYNLSTALENSGFLTTPCVIDILLSFSTAKETSEKSLATIGNLAVTLPGKRALEDHPSVPETFIEIITWEDKPKCQELSAYMLMILAHQSSKQREKMSSSGIVPVLLEVALLGSPLAQKRALKMLQWFKDEREAKVGPHSGPQTRRVWVGSPVSERETSEAKRMMKKMVKQSLYKNMEVITRRANAAGESSKLKSLIVSSSSKSLPY